MIHQPMLLREIEKRAVEMEVPLNHAIGARRNYLWKDLAYWLETETDPVTWAVLCVPRIWAIIDDLVRLQRDLHWKHKPARKGELTDEEKENMKERARAYPVERLIEFDSQGKAFCLWHEDKRPSMGKSNRKNAVRCYVCNKSFDPIDIVMRRDGKKYYEAVKVLCGQ